MVDPRTLKPYDEETVTRSAKKTGRVVVVHEAPMMGGFGGEVVARLAASDAFWHLDRPIKRLGGLDIPIPYNRHLERRAVPQEEDIIAAVRELVA